MQQSTKPLLFKSFTGITVQEFDDICDKDITRICEKYVFVFIKNEIEKEKEYTIELLTIHIK